MNTTDFELMYTALDEMEETPETEGFHAGLGEACKALNVPVNVQHNKDLVRFFGRHRAKLVAAFKEGKPRFMAVCESCAKRDAAEGKV